MTDITQLQAVPASYRTTKTEAHTADDVTIELPKLPEMPKFDVPELPRVPVASLPAEEPNDLEIRVYPIGGFTRRDAKSGGAADFILDILLSKTKGSWTKVDYYPAVNSLVVCERKEQQAMLAELLPLVAAEKDSTTRELLILQRGYERAAAKQDGKEARRIAEKILAIAPMHFAKSKVVSEDDAGPKIPKPRIGRVNFAESAEPELATETIEPANYLEPLVELSHVKPLPAPR